MDKLASAKTKLEKLEKKVAWHENRIAKLEVKLSKAVSEDDIYWANCDLETAHEEYDRAKENLAEYKEYIAKLEVKIKEKEEKNKIPDIFVDFKNNLVARWDEYDKKERDRILALGESFYRDENDNWDWIKYNIYDSKRNLTDEKIHRDNENSAIDLIWSLINRVKEKVGEIKDFFHLHITDANEWTDGGVAINGYVEGNKGKCEVRSIVCGGYNIQRIHYRTLVREIK